MFFDVLKKLCDDKGIAPSRVATEIGFSKGSVSYWKKQYLKGVDSKPDSHTAAKIADYFNVSVDYLLGRTEDATNYTDEDLIASQNPNVLSHFNGDTKKAVEFQKAVDNDVKNERKIALFIEKYNRLDSIDQDKVNSYMDGLLAADKYSIDFRLKNA